MRFPAKQYMTEHYATDFAVFGGDTMCGFTLTDALRPPKRSRFVGLPEFVICQFELNLLSQAIFTHCYPAFAEWHAYSVPFADPRSCFLGHGMGNHMPYSILRFAQEPRAAEKTAPVELDWNMLGEYTRYCFGDYLSSFCSANPVELTPEWLIDRMSIDQDCIACVRTASSWETRHVSQMTSPQATGLNNHRRT